MLLCAAVERLLPRQIRRAPGERTEPAENSPMESFPAEKCRKVDDLALSSEARKIFGKAMTPALSCGRLGPVLRPSGQRYVHLSHGIE